LRSENISAWRNHEKFNLVFLLACLLVSSLACQFIGQIFASQAKPGPLVNPLFTIEVPEGWQAFSSLDIPSNLPPLDLHAEVLGVIVDTSAVLHTSQQDYFTYTVFFLRKPIPGDSSLEEVYQQTYENIVLAYPNEIKENQTGLSGEPALERVYPYFSGEPRYDIRDLWLEKDGFAYILSCRARSNLEIDLYQQDLQGILDSFQFN
jgi:hypothetical protein